MSIDHNKVCIVKFGGSSFATPARIALVCDWIAKRLRQRGPSHRMVCVVSAPTGLTERHREELLALNPAPSARLIDAGLPLADSLGAVLVAAALQARGVDATVVMGNQIGLRTDTNFCRARLQSVDLAPMQRHLAQHEVVVVPGGQASAEATGETTWMGKNSSDLSAIALAIAFGSESVEICSDVPGVYSSDPSLVPDAMLLPRLSHQQAIEMSVSGAKVLHHGGVQHALHGGLRIVCRRNCDGFDVGTVIEADSRFEAVVVPDTRAQTFAGSPAVIEQATQMLDAAAATYRLMPPGVDAQRTLVVTCGFFDAWQFLGIEHGLALRRQSAQLLTLIDADGTVHRELVEPRDLMQRARQLHARHHAPPVTVPPIVPSNVPSPDSSHV